MEMSKDTFTTSWCSILRDRTGFNMENMSRSFSMTAIGDNL